MAENFISGHDGNVTLPAGHGGKIVAFTLRASMARKDVSYYKASATRFRDFRGGLFEVSGTLRGMARQGASGTAPGIGSAGIDGASLTLTAMTGCTWSGTALFDEVAIDHAFDNPAIDLSYNFVFSSTVVETWAVA